MKAPKIVQAPEGRFSSFTPGKNYQVIGLWSTDYNDKKGFRFIIRTDQGRIARCLENECNHIDLGNWIIIERES